MYPRHFTQPFQLFIVAVLLAGLVFSAAPPQVAQAAPSTWSPTGSLNTGRWDHTATLLPDGRVLVAGGVNSSSGYLTSAEVYDPAAGTWSATGGLTIARSDHTATLLTDGRVLVAGGCYRDFGYHYLTSAEVYDPATGTWSATDSLTTGRSNHTATLLPDGRVLVAGGWDGSFLTSVEVYDPAAGTWSATDSLTTGRSNHTATLLPDGRVLVVGGYNGSSHLTSAEVYDPAAGTWSPTGGMNTGRNVHTATLLPDGRVLVAGGYAGSGVWLISAEVYDPATGTWSPTGGLTNARAHHTATLLPDGRVLVVGGSGGSYLTSAEVYDPATGTWSPTGGLTNVRSDHTATLLPDGRVLVVGGAHYSSLTSVEVYDPAAGTWSATDSLTTGRYDHTATLLPDGRVLVAGGYGYDGSYHYLTSAEVYDPTAGTWSATGGLNTGRDKHTATLLPDGRVLVAGGWSGGTLTSAEVYDPAAGTWSATDSLTTGRYDHTATLLPDGRVLVAGGLGSGTLTSAEVYDPAGGTWSTTGGLNNARYAHTATLLPDGRVLVAGGWSGGTLTSAEVYDPAAGIWSATGGLNTGRYAHTATLLPDGRVLVAGGYNYDSGCLTSAEVYDPAAGTWSATGGLNTGRYAHTATLLPDGRVPVAGGYNNSYPLTSAEVYDPAAGTWSATGGLNTGRYAHTATLLPDGRVLVAGGYNYDSGCLTSAEVYDRGLGFQSAWRPLLNTVTSPLVPGTPLLAGGSRFRGLSEASGGNYQNSATNYPLLQLRRVDNEQVRWLRPDPTTGFSDTAFTSVPLTDFPLGHALVTVFANGIPSVSKIIAISSPGDCQVLTGVTISGATNGVTGQAYTFITDVSPSNADPPITYQWSPEPDSGQGTNQATYTWNTAGNKTISVSVSNCNGSGAANDSHTIAISSPCQVLTGVTISGATSGVTGQGYTFTANVSPTEASTPITYNWSPEPNSGQGTNQATYTWHTAGNQTISVSVSNCNGSGAANDSHTIAISGKVYLPIVMKGYCTDNYEPNDSFNQAYGPLTSGQTYRSYISCYDVASQRDYFYIDINTTNPIEVDLTNIPAGVDYDLYLYNSAQDEVSRSWEPGNAPEHISYTPTSPGRYYILVFSPYSHYSNSPYSLRVTYD